MRLSLEYVAGFLDCDGTVVVVKANTGKRPRYYGKIMFYSQNLTALEGVKDTVGGKIWAGYGVYRLQLSPRDAVAALTALVPYLIIKKEQAKRVLILQEMIRNTKQVGNRITGGSQFLADSIYDAREAIYQEVRSLNRVDSQAFKKNWKKSVEAPEGVIPSQAEGGQEDSLDPSEGVTTSSLSPNNNASHEPPARKGRDSLSSTILKIA